VRIHRVKGFSGVDPEKLVQVVPVHVSLRARVIQDITPMVGFPFSEPELSPTLRRRVGELEPMYQQLDVRSLELTNLAKQKGSYQLVLFFLGIIGVLFLVFGIVSWPLAIIGAACFGLAYLFYQSFVLENSLKIRQKETEISQLKTDARSRLDSLSKEIYEELSAMHSIRSHPQSQGSIVKETIVKEVVMIPCAFCRSLMPQTSTFCPNCGARRRG
jgi:hypothetical protein